MSRPGGYVQGWPGCNGADVASSYGEATNAVSGARGSRAILTKLLICHAEVDDAILPDVVEEEAVVDVSALLILVRDPVQNVLRKAG